MAPSALGTSHQQAVAQAANLLVTQVVKVQTEQRADTRGEIAHVSHLSFPELLLKTLLVISSPLNAKEW